jgi:hypothetical protein
MNYFINFEITVQIVDVALTVSYFENSFGKEFQSKRNEDGDSKFLRNVSIYQRA